jgi:Tfp pilus assembly protein PilZ
MGTRETIVRSQPGRYCETLPLGPIVDVVQRTRSLRLIHPAIGEMRLLLTRSGLVVGRGPEVDLSLAWDLKVSRRHARLMLQSGEVWIEDLASRNGVWIGNARLGVPAVLWPKTSALIGETALEIETVPDDAMPLPTEDVAFFNHSAHGPITIEAPIDPATREVRPVDRNPPPFPQRMRTEPRFLANDQIELAVEGREELRELWMKDISKGGLFVATEDPLEIGKQVRVVINTADGQIQLQAMVVHVVRPDQARSSRATAGLGLQFVDLLPEKKEAIARYIDGLAANLDGAQNATIPELRAVTDPETSLRRAKIFFELVDRNDLYGALGLDPDANEAEIDHRLKVFRDECTTALAAVTPPRSERLERAIALVDRVRPLMTDPIRRLHYDFRSGHIRPEERIAKAIAGQGPSIADLRQAWLTVAPERMARAASLTREAIAFKQRGLFAEAAICAREVLEDDPFFTELRPALRAWETLAKAAAKPD